MSVDLLRTKAMMGKADELGHILLQGGNPCSADQFGLTALHYAVWNGHVRCCELLCVNDVGRDYTGTQCSCIDLQSRKGMTALMLAASEGINGPACIKVLTSFDADTALISRDGRTAMEYALDFERPDCVKALQLRDEDEEGSYKRRRQLVQQFRVQRAQLKASSASTNDNNADKASSSNRPFTPPRCPPRPKELMLFEHEIVPFAKTNFKGRHEPETIEKLRLAQEQAVLNERRRRALAQSLDNSIKDRIAGKNI